MAEGESNITGGPAVAPPDLSGEFPGVTTANFQGIKTAPYKPINPMRFAKRWGAFNRSEILKNYQLANDIAQRELDTELAGLSKFAPAAAALKRQETAADNAFNQAQRTQQVNSTMPGVSKQLADQAARAQAYAEGRAPDSITDRALELNIRSASADRSAAGGFGQSSSVARKASDLMSAEQRIQLSQYGDQLTNQNIQTTANLMLAPTAYSDAGQQIRTMPEVGGSRLAAGALSEANQLTMMQPGTVLSAKLQQRQFVTGLEQQTRMFNAQGNFAESQFNAQAANQFALSKFGYQVGLAGVQAGVETANNNTALGLAQQQQYGQIFQDQMAAAQSAGQVGAIAQGGGAGASLIPSVINAVGGLFSPNNTPNQTQGIPELGIPSVGYDTGQSENPSAPANVFGSGDIEFGIDGPTIGGHAVEAPINEPNAYPTSEPNFSQGTPDFSVDYNQPESSGYTFMGGEGGGSFDGFNLKVGNPGYQFQQATGLPYHPSFQNSTNATMQMAGIATNQQAIPNAVELGVNYEGKKVYSNPVLARGTDPDAGARTIQTLGQVMAPFEAFNDQDQIKLDTVGLAASDPELINSLSESASRGDVPGFVQTTLKHFGKDVSKIANPPDKNGLATAHTAYEVMQNFNQASPEQKGLLVAGMGLKAADFQGKRSLGEVILPKTLKPATKPVTAAHALKWFAQGINAYPLTNKWDQFSVIAQIASGSNDPDTVAQTANKLGLLGAGVSGAEVPNVTEESLAKDGWSVTPHLGIGAIAGTKGAKLPQGFVEVHSDGQNIVAAPKGTAYTAKGALSRFNSWNQGASGSAGAAGNIPQGATGSEATAGTYIGDASNFSPDTVVQPGAPRKDKPVVALGTSPETPARLGSNGKAPSGWSTWTVGKDNNLVSTQNVPGLKSAKPQSLTQQAVGWSQAAFNIYNAWSRKPGTQSAIQTAGIISGQIDRYNQTEVANKVPGAETTNYGQYAGALASGYNAFQQAQQGNYAQATGHGTQAALQGAQAYYNTIGDKVTANSMGQYAGYAESALAAYNAYQAYKHGDKTGTAVNAAAAGASLYNPGAGSAIMGAYQTYQGWGSGSAKNGVIGGSMMMAGMAMMGMPIIGAALMATAIISNSIKTGKHKDQNARDAIREGWQEQGFLVDKQYNVTLADGTLFNIGLDGHGGEHEITNPELINNPDEIQKSGKLHAYDVDYTNDLDYAASMGGMALTRLLFGAKAKNIDDIGGQLGNAALGNIGYNQAMTKENFDKMQANMRGFYAKAGIGSKEDLYQLANAAFAEGRLSEADYMAAQQTAEMMYGDGENGYNLAKQLLQGRHQGMDAAGRVVAADKRPESDKKEPEPQPVPAGATGSEASMMPAGDMTAWSGANPAAENAIQIEGDAMPAVGTQPAIDLAPMSEGAERYPQYLKGPKALSLKDINFRGSNARRSKEEIRAMNESRYAGGV